VPEFLTDWDKYAPDKKEIIPEPGKHKSSLKRTLSPDKDSGSPSKKQANLLKWFVKK